MMENDVVSDVYANFFHKDTEMSPDDAVVGVTNAPTSPARIRANRQNAQKSTGPKTEEGKAIARANGLRHGLTGSGVVLPDAMRAEVDRLIAAFTREFQPTTEGERQLIEQRALGLVRSKAAWSAETMHLVERSERAASPGLWEADRKAEAVELAARLTRTPELVVPKLKGGLHGAQCLLDRWLLLDTALDQRGCWDEEEQELATRLSGLPEICVGQDPMGLSRMTLDELRQLVSERIAELDALIADDLRLQDERDRERAIAGFPKADSPTYRRLYRYTMAADRIQQKAADEMRRIERERAAAKGVADQTPALASVEAVDSKVEEKTEVEARPDPPPGPSPGPVDGPEGPVAPPCVAFEQPTPRGERVRSSRRREKRKARQEARKRKRA